MAGQLDRDRPGPPLLALDTADAVIMRDDLATIPAVITLSRRARRVVIANLAIAAAIIAGLVA